MDKSISTQELYKASGSSERCKVSSHLFAGRVLRNSFPGEQEQYRERKRGWVDRSGEETLEFESLRASISQNPEKIPPPSSASFIPRKRKAGKHDLLTSTMADFSTEAKNGSTVRVEREREREISEEKCVDDSSVPAIK